jgi:hypothetical protein
MVLSSMYQFYLFEVKFVGLKIVFSFVRDGLELVN